MMTQREELLAKIKEEDAALDHQLEALDFEAQRAQPGIRQFRRQRLVQLRQRQSHLRRQMQRVEQRATQTWDSTRPEAERLWSEFQSTRGIAGRTFTQRTFA